MINFKLITEGKLGELNRAFAEISRLKEERSKYRRERDELKAHIVRLGFDIKFLLNYLEEQHGEYITTGLVYLSEETPKQSLAQIKARAIRDAVHCSIDELDKRRELSLPEVSGYGMAHHQILEYANNLLNQGKDNE